MKQIESFSLTHLLIGAHYKFHELTVKDITAATPQALHVKEVFPKYKTNVETEFKHLNPIFRMPYTDEIVESDKARDLLVRHLFRSTKTMMRHPHFNEYYAANELWRIISIYDGVWNYEMGKQTELIYKMINDLKEGSFEITVSDYVGEYFLEKLFQENQTVEIRMNERLEEMMKKEKIDISALRHETNELYREIRLLINAFAIAMPTEKIIGFIDNHNAQISEYRRVISGMRRGGAGTESLPPENGQLTIDS